MPFNYFFYGNFASNYQVMKLSWAAGILIAILAFVGFIMYFFVITLIDKKYDHELVTEDYYAQELEYQKNIDTELPPISIIIPTHDNFSELQRNLPIFLRQQYAGSYQVIVVADKGDHETENLMKRLMSEYNNLYATYLPDSSRYMSRIKLAITLGVKAAKTDWISITDPTCRPADEFWLASWGQNMTDDTDFVMGFTLIYGITTHRN